MKLGKRVKVVFDVFAIWVLAYTFLFIASWTLFMFVFSPAADPFLQAIFSTGFQFVILPLGIVTIVLGIILGALCVIHVLRNQSLSLLFRIVVFLGFWIAPIFTIPAYYWLVVRKEPTATSIA